MADIMKEREIRAKTKRPFTPRTTGSAHQQPAVGNVLDRQFKAGRPDRKWAVDITCVATDEGWLYLAGVMDLCSRKIVGWSMADHMETSLVSDALRMAIAQRCPAQGLLHHSDRGSQYTSDGYMDLLRSHGMAVSMSGVGQCWDNAVKESFWATLKTELVHHDCDHCPAAVPLYAGRLNAAGRTTAGARLAVVEMPPFAAAGELPAPWMPLPASVLAGRLDQQRDWFAATPVAVLLQDGQVIAARDGAAAERPDPGW